MRVCVSARTCVRTCVRWRLIKRKKTNNHHNNGGGGGGAGGKHDASGQRVSDSPSRGMQSGSVKISRALIEWASSPEAEAAVNEINSNLRCEVRVLFRF